MHKFIFKYFERRHAFFLVALSIIILAFCGIIFFDNPTSPAWASSAAHKNGANRSHQQTFDYWKYPKKVPLSGGTYYQVDVTDGGMQMLDMSDCPTAGASLFFVGADGAYTETTVVIHGTGEIIDVGTNSPVAYASFVIGASTDVHRTWPFPRTLVQGNTYVLRVISGIDGPGEVSGATVYLAGITVLQ